MGKRLKIINLAKLNTGLLLLALSISVMLNAHTGVDPWSVFHDGISQHTPISFGTISLLSGLSVLALASFWLKAPVGIGSILNILLIGPYVDLFNMSGLVPVQNSLAIGLVQLCCGVLGMAVSIGLYVNADLGAGPRESLVLGISQKFAISVRAAKIFVEIGVLATGIILGGQFGIGTIIFASCIGFLMQFFLKLLKKPQNT